MLIKENDDDDGDKLIREKVCEKKLVKLCVYRINGWKLSQKVVSCARAISRQLNLK